VFGSMCVLALMASPLSVGAQAGEDGTSAKPNAEEPVQSTEPTGSRLERSHPEALPDPSKPKPTSMPVYVDPNVEEPAAPAKQANEEPVLQLKLNPLGGVDAVPSLTPTAPVTAAQPGKSGVGMGIGIAVAVVVVGLAVGLGVAAASVKRNVLKGHVPGPASMGPGTIVTRAR